jgi:hypothetical protein
MIEKQMGATNFVRMYSEISGKLQSEKKRKREEEK